MSKTSPPVIKYTGSKRSQASEIIRHIPNSFGTYYEPFVGSGAVMRCLIDNRLFYDFKGIECSDINGDLISFWNMIKENPTEIADSYERLWEEFNSGDDSHRKEYFNHVRQKFNVTRDPSLFLFLSRTSLNGLIRYNSRQEFNSSCHYSRSGIEPKKLKNIIFDWSNRLNDNEVVFRQTSYENINPSEDDFLYADPPYATVSRIASSAYISNGFNQKKFFDWLGSLKCGWILSYDGKAGEIDNTYAVPKGLYEEHLYIKSGNSSFRRIIAKTSADVYESLYIRYPKF